MPWIVVSYINIIISVRKYHFNISHVSFNVFISHIIMMKIYTFKSIKVKMTIRTYQLISGLLLIVSIENSITHYFSMNIAILSKFSSDFNMFNAGISLFFFIEVRKHYQLKTLKQFPHSWQGSLSKFFS